LTPTRFSDTLEAGTNRLPDREITMRRFSLTLAALTLLCPVALGVDVAELTPVDTFRIERTGD